ncbi:MULTISPECIES: helix-turn-helix transcriptional regulator [Paenibacillus]|uniref:Helix-turn-helix protein n=1 Tax=Paenibacillus pabuli TaxID=1472 RepID=A0A855Y8E6_9BACL|nr:MULTISPECIES: helix-turn-helix transcriptional regulator [Paenibacillus]PWW38884.1 helix-turn-helix protein [Paenibacillus pabuli]PXW06069.1 helix-turn-helix protein [Paenibacillus taichungensis]
MKLLFSFLFRHKPSDIETPTSLSNIELHFNEIMSYIRKDFRSATLTSTAEHMHLSKQYICRIIQQVSGINFSKLLFDVKLKKAVQYFKESKLKLEEIADLTGFSDVSHFSRTFKSHFGLTPSKYRAQHKVEL